jgi:hypothetical protein
MGSDCIKKTTPREYYGGDNPNFADRDWNKSWQEDLKNRYSNMGNGFLAHKDGYNIYKGGFLYDLEDQSNEIRSHPDLVFVVEKLGKKSWGDYAELKIVDVPDDVKWEIDDYDGMETIHECHKTWS